MEHTELELKIIKEYENAVDAEVVSFVKTVLSGNEVLPITVAFLSEKAANEIENLTGKKVFGNRVVLDSNGINHIEARHGANGQQDSSMKNIEDIARMGYVINNYDEIEYFGEYATGYVDAQGKLSPKVVISKKIDGTYYVIEAVSDAKKHRNYIVSAFIKKATH